MMWIDFKEWWFNKWMLENPGLIKQVEAANKRDYEEITNEELEDFIKEISK